MTPQELFARLVVAQERGDLSELDALLDAARERGDLDTQIIILRELLSLAQQNVNRIAEIETLRLLGNVYQEKGQLQRAHSYRVTAAKLAQELDSGCPSQMRMLVEGDLGRSYIQVHMWSEAEFHTRRALELAEALHDERLGCIYQMNLGVVYMDTDRRTQAKELWTTVLSAAEQLNDRYILGLLHANMAGWMLGEARINDCQRHARKALAYADFSGDDRLRAHVKQIIGASFHAAHLATDRRDYSIRAEHHLHETLELARALDHPSMEAQAEIRLAEIYEDRRPREAASHYQRALDLMETVRRDLGYEKFQLTYFETLQPLYDRVVEFLLRQRQPDHAFRNAEQLRSRLLLALLGQRRSNTHLWSVDQQAELKNILDLYGHEVIGACLVEGGFSRNRGKVVGIRDLSDGQALDSPGVSETRQGFLNLYESQRLQQAQWQPWQSPPVVGVEEAQRLIRTDEALLSYLVTDQSVIIFAVTDVKYHFQHLTYPRDKMTNDVEELCLAMETVQDRVLDDIPEQWFGRKLGDPWPTEIIEPMTTVHRVLKKLFALLVAPVLAVIDQKPHWMIVPHGPLHRIPWAALHGQGRYLVEQHSISVLPSVSLGAALGGRELPVAGEAVFLADPDPDHPILELNAAQQEVQSGYEAFQAGPPPLIGSAATKREFLARAPAARLLHIACHGFFNASEALLSFLKLAGDRGSDFLYAFEIAELSLHAELVSLPACQSGRSRIVTGDEQTGIVRAFLAAGAHSIISALWSIEDVSASAFFMQFYRNAQVYPLGQALAITQRHLLAEPQFELPCFWAPYILTGQWRRSLNWFNNQATK